MHTQNDDLQLIERERFSRENPPQGLEVAENALEQLEYEISHVEVQLEHRTSRDFENYEAYESWKKRAMGALAHMRLEKNYLEKWIRAAQDTARASQNNATPSSGFIRKSVNSEEKKRLQSAILQMAERISREYFPRFSVNNPPDTSDIAQARLVVLLRLHHVHTKFSVDLRSEASKCGIGPDRLKTMRKPLADVYAPLISEYTYLLRFYRENEGVHDLNGVLLPLLERAIESGLTLSTIEVKAVEYIRFKVSLQE